MSLLTLTRRVVLAGFAGLTLLTALPAAAETPPQIIRLWGQGSGYGKPYGIQVIGVLRAKGLLEEEFKGENIQIEWTFPTGTGPAINEALASRRVDFANYGGLPNIIGKSRGLPTKILASYGVGHAYLVVGKDLPIARVEDLKGRSIAVTRGTVPHLTLLRVLEQHGLAESDVNLFELSGSDEVPALATGQVDAGWGGAGFLKLVDDGLAKVIYTSKGSVSRANSFGSFLVTEDFAEKYPETTKRVVKAFLRAAHWASQPENREEVLDIWALTGEPRDALAKNYEGVDFAEMLSPLVDEFFLGQLQAGIDFSLENKLIRQPVDLASWVDRSFIDAAIKELGYENVWTPRDALGAPQS